MEEKKKRITIEIDPEFDEVLKRLEAKIKAVAWDGLNKISPKQLTRILARKVTSSKIV